MQETIQKQQYQKLVRELEKLIKSTAITGSKALNRQKLSAYWQIGKRLATIKNLTTTFLSQLGNQLTTSPIMLYRCRQFFETWPKDLKGLSTELSWSHHLLLIPVADKKARDFYINETVKNGWGRDSLKIAIDKNLYDKTSAELLPKAKPEFDLPFNIYPAEPLEVIDGDTLDVRLDLGFHTWSSQRVRLRGINCAEIRRGGVTPPGFHQSPHATNGSGNPTPTGDLAKEFVINKLKDIKILVIKTHKTDIYGRYVADVYYHPSYTKKADIIKYGFCLNQQLIEAGLAVPMMV